MKIEKIMASIVILQEKLENLDNKISDIKRRFPLDMIFNVIFIICVLILVTGKTWGMWIGAGIIICQLFLKSVGWRKSVKKWLFLTVVVDGIIIILLVDTINLPNGYHQWMAITGIFLFFLLWIFFSLLAINRVAKLVNEIIASISATIFSIGTFLTSFYSPNMSQFTIQLQQLENNLDNISDEEMIKSVGDLFVYEGVKIANGFFIIMLPIIGVSAICVVFILLKEYWMSKYGIVEIGEKKEDSTSWVFNNLSRYDELSELFMTDNEFLAYRIKNNNSADVINNRDKNIILRDFQNQKRDFFLNAIEIDEEIQKPFSQDVDVRINIAKTINVVDELTTDYKAMYYGNLIRNAYFFCGKMEAEEFDMYFDFINRILVSNLKLIRNVSEYYHFIHSTSISVNEFFNYVDNCQFVDSLKWLLEEDILLRTDSEDEYLLSDKFKRIDKNILLSYEECIADMNSPIM